jgi:sugar diacid utilization regulator
MSFTLAHRQDTLLAAEPMTLADRPTSRRLPSLDVGTRAICEQVAERLDAEAEDLATVMTDAVFDEIPAYRSIAAPVVHGTVLAHSLDHVHAVARAIRTWSLPSGEELVFVKTRGALRASQQVPLTALLHSYRLGHRTVWERLVRLLARFDNPLDAALALTTLTLSYTDLISVALAEGYVERQRSMLAELDRDRRDLLENILQGTLERKADTLRLASSFALVPGGDFLVVVMSRVSESQMPAGEAETRAAEALRRHLAMGVAQPFVVIRHGEVVSIAPLARARAAAIARLVRMAHAELAQRGERWAAGISTMCSGLVEVARGYQEARRAFESVAVDGGVCVLLETRVHDYLVQRSDGTALRMIPSAGRRVFESTSAADHILVETLKVYARAEMSARVAADQLAVHPNTVTYRLQKLGELLGRDLAKFSDLVEVLTWASLIELSRRDVG